MATSSSPRLLHVWMGCNNFCSLGEGGYFISINHTCSMMKHKRLLWSYGSYIYNYLCHGQCLSPLMLWVGISIRARCTTLCDKICLELETGRWFSPGPLVSSTNKTDRHDITEILLKVALNTNHHHHFHKSCM